MVVNKTGRKRRTPDSVVVEFVQSYESDVYRDKVRKLVVRQPDATTEELIKTVLRG